MNKPKVTLTEKDVSSIDDQMFAAWHTLLEAEGNWELICEGPVTARNAALKLRGRANGDVVVFGAPTDKNENFYRNWLRSQDVPCVDEKPCYGLHAHQRETIKSLLESTDTFSMGMWRGLGIHHTPIRADNYMIQGMPMILNPLMHSDRFGFEYKTVGGNWLQEGFSFIEDNYVAPPKEPKSWDKTAQHWYKVAMGSKTMMNIALHQYRMTRPHIYAPKFEWDQQREARRKLAFIKHVNVGTVGHIDWGTNSLRRPRPQCPGILADCIRAAIKDFK